jgi:hypothetical protein
MMFQMVVGVVGSRWLRQDIDGDTCTVEFDASLILIVLGFRNTQTSKAVPVHRRASFEATPSRTRTRATGKREYDIVGPLRLSYMGGDDTCAQCWPKRMQLSEPDSEAVETSPT